MSYQIAIDHLKSLAKAVENIDLPIESIKTVITARTSRRSATEIGSKDACVRVFKDEVTPLPFLNSFQLTTELNLHFKWNEEFLEFQKKGNDPSIFAAYLLLAYATSFEKLALKIVSDFESECKKLPDYLSSIKLSLRDVSEQEGEEVFSSAKNLIMGSLANYEKAVLLIQAEQVKIHAHIERILAGLGPKDLKSYKTVPANLTRAIRQSKVLQWAVRKEILEAIKKLHPDLNIGTDNSKYIREKLKKYQNDLQCIYLINFYVRTLERSMREKNFDIEEAMAQCRLEPRFFKRYYVFNFQDGQKPRDWLGCLSDRLAVRR